MPKCRILFVQIRLSVAMDKLAVQYRVIDMAAVSDLMLPAAPTEHAVLTGTNAGQPAIVTAIHPLAMPPHS